MVDGLLTMLGNFIGGLLADSILYKIGYFLLPIKPKRPNRELIASIPVVLILVGVTLLFHFA
jgi:hypothetical protein